VSAAVASVPRALDAGSGRTRVTARALQQVAAAVAGDALGVGAKRVDARLTDAGGSLDIVAHAPIRVVSIARLHTDARSLDRTGGSVLDRCAKAEHVIRDRMQALTGYTVRRVTVRITDVEIQQESRVR
jgi:hypothetical protein